MLFKFNFYFLLVFILVLTKKQTKYRQIFLTLFFIVNIVLLDRLVLFNLKNSEMLFIGIYESVFFFYMIKGASVFISSLGFSFMLIYLSFVLLADQEDIITILANFAICFLEAYLIKLNQKTQEGKFMKKIKEKEKMHYLFEKVFPGINILIKFNEKVSPEHKEYNLFDHNDVQLELINEKGKKKFGLHTLEDFRNFCSKVKIRTLHSNYYISDEYEHNHPHSLEFLFKKMLISTNIDASNMLIGTYEESESKMRISICNYYWDHSAYVIIYIDDENFEMQIQNLKENDIKKNELLASVTHDLRSPLNGMIAFINTAKECEEQEKRNQYLEYAEVNAHLLLSLINDILDYSSFLNNKIRINEDKFKLSTVIQEISNLMSIQTSFKNLNFVIKNDLPEDLLLISDSRRIKQILINLIGNSIKFTLKGEVILHIKSKMNDSIIEFIVSDTGVGIPSDHISKLCQPYATFDTKDQLNKEGIGLGLNICKKLISLLGPTGNLKIKSKEGEGTQIKFRLFKNLKSSKDETSESEVMISQRTITRARILQNQKLNSNFSIFCKPSLQNLEKNLTKTDSKNNEIELKIKTNISLKEEILDLKSNLNVEFNSEYAINSNSSCKIHSIPILKKKSVFYELERLSSEKNEEKFFKKKEGSIMNNFSSNMPSLQVLIVDDCPFNCLVISNYLKKMKKYNILFNSVSNGLECLNIFLETNHINTESQTIQIIILDCIMPIKNGYETAKEIKRLAKIGTHYDAFIIGSTSLNGEAEEKKCLESGMDFILEKPVGEKEIFEIFDMITKFIYVSV